MNDELVSGLQRLVQIAPIDLLMQITKALDSSEDWTVASVSVLRLLHSPVIKDLFAQIVREAQEQRREVSELAFALQTACAINAFHRSAPILELVLSGPILPPFDLRRTDEALLQLIQLTSNRLTLMSFALYRLDRLSSALVDAVNRSVRVRMLVDAKALKRTDINSLYGQFLRDNMEFFVWSANSQANSMQGENGVFHAKAAIGDGYRLLVSSANLTENAMTANVELGVMIEGGELPARVESVFNNYLDRGFFVRI